MAQSYRASEMKEYLFTAIVTLICIGTIWFELWAWYGTKAMISALAVLIVSFICWRGFEWKHRYD